MVISPFSGAEAFRGSGAPSLKTEVSGESLIGNAGKINLLTALFIPHVFPPSLSTGREI